MLAIFLKLSVDIPNNTKTECSTGCRFFYKLIDANRDYITLSESVGRR